MTLHSSTFQYLQPSDEQLTTMSEARELFDQFVRKLDLLLPVSGDDKDYVIRLLRTAAMWTNVAITRKADGAPR